MPLISLVNQGKNSVPKNLQILWYVFIVKLQYCVQKYLVWQGPLSKPSIIYFSQKISFFRNITLKRFLWKQKPSFSFLQQSSIRAFVPSFRGWSWYSGRFCYLLYFDRVHFIKMWRIVYFSTYHSTSKLNFMLFLWFRKKIHF